MAPRPADPDLVQTLDYILNRSDSSTIEVIAEAVARRRRDLTIFNSLGDIPDPQRMARAINEKINAGFGGSIDVMRNSIREMMVRIIREHAPELNESQIEELINTWLPVPGNAGKNSKDKIPKDALLSMIEQFISFSNGTMNESVDKNLREEMGEWPKRYWKAFPPVVRRIISDYLKDKITEREFKSKIVTALGL